MAKFNFKFDSVKRVKEILEKKAQKEIAVIEMEIDKCNKKYAELVEEEVRLHKKGLGKKIKADKIHQVINYENSIKEKQKLVEEKIRKLNSQKEIKLEELVKRSKEHKIFNTLEDIYLEEYTYGQNRLDLIKIDEVATQQFMRRSK